ncbi:PucR family transcriptional regulator [Streptomyces sp. NPDC055078]
MDGHDPLNPLDGHDPLNLLDGYAELLEAAAATGRRPWRAELEARRAAGGRALEHSVSLRALVEAHLTATEASWERVTRQAVGTAAQLRGVGQAVLTATSLAVSAAADGYEGAQRKALDGETASRSEFVRDLLSGTRDLSRLMHRARRFGLTFAGAQTVTVARSEDGFKDADSAVRAVETALVSRFGAHNVLVAVHDSLLVCVVAATLRGAVGEFAHRVFATLGANGGWQIGVGRPHAGPGGVRQSFEEARETLDVGRSLGFRAPILHAADFLVFPVLLRDRAAMTDLVQAVLGPLQGARKGAEPLLDTLSALFACRGNNAAAARQLGITVRAVTYRLERIHRMTGYSATEETQRFTLEAAVLGARLLGWPGVPLPGPD